MSRRNRQSLLLVGISLVGALILGLAVWAAADADEEPTAATLAVADLEPASGNEGSGRMEIVMTGDRSWVKLQLRGVDAEGTTLRLTSDDGAEPQEIPVDGDGDYTVAGDVPLDGTAELRDGEVLLLAGPIEAID